MIILLYLLTPFIIRLKGKISKLQYFTLALICMLIGIILGMGTFQFEWGVNSLKYIGFFLIGDIMKNGINKDKCKTFIYSSIMIVSIIIVVILRKTEVIQGIRVLPMNIYSSVNPFITIASISLFGIINNLKNIRNNDLLIKGCVQFSKDSYWIYLIHALILELILKIDHIISKFNGQIILIILGSILCVILSWGTGNVMKKCYILFIQTNIYKEKGKDYNEKTCVFNHGS